MSAPPVDLSEIYAPTTDGQPSDAVNDFDCQGNPSDAVNDSDHQGPTRLIDLQSELLELVASTLLANSPHDVLSLCQACSGMHSKLGAVRALVEHRRLSWRADATLKHDIRDRTLLVGEFERTDPEPWAAGELLPTAGRSSWTIRIERSRRNDGNGIWVGVCDAAMRISWGLFLYSGRLRRMCRNAAGKLDFDATPASGLPNGNYQIVMKGADGKPCSLRGGANGALIEILVDHDLGALGFRVNGGRYLDALPKLDKAFPRGTPLRPYASCYYPGDSVSFASAILRVEGDR